MVAGLDAALGALSAIGNSLAFESNCRGFRDGVIAAPIQDREGLDDTANVGRRPADILDGVENENPDLNDNESEIEEELEEPEPGPVFIFFESTDPNDRLNSIMQRVSLSYSNYVFNQVPKSREKFIEATPSSP